MLGRERRAAAPVAAEKLYYRGAPLRAAPTPPLAVASVSAEQLEQVGGGHWTVGSADAAAAVAGGAALCDAQSVRVLLS